MSDPISLEALDAIGRQEVLRRRMMPKPRRPLPPTEAQRNKGAQHGLLALRAKSTPSRR